MKSEDINNLFFEFIGYNLYDRPEMQKLMRALKDYNYIQTYSFTASQMYWCLKSITFLNDEEVYFVTA